MWSPTALDPPHQCLVCKTGAGPYWIGPPILTGEPGFGGEPQRGRVSICKGCVMVLANEADSPYHGLIPQGERARMEIMDLNAKLASALERLKTLEHTGGLPVTVATAAVKAAIDELEERGYVVRELVES